jgi:hypothetical protein
MGPPWRDLLCQVLRFPPRPADDPPLEDTPCRVLALSHPSTVIPGLTNSGTGNFSLASRSSFGESPTMARLARVVVPGFPHHATHRDPRLGRTFSARRTRCFPPRVLTPAGRRLGPVVGRSGTAGKHVPAASPHKDRTSLRRALVRGKSGGNSRKVATPAQARPETRIEDLG